VWVAETAWEHYDGDLHEPTARYCTASRTLLLMSYNFQRFLVDGWVRLAVAIQPFVALIQSGKDTFAATAPDILWMLLPSFEQMTQVQVPRDGGAWTNSTFKDVLGAAKVVAVEARPDHNRYVAACDPQMCTHYSTAAGPRILLSSAVTLFFFFRHRGSQLIQ
jgi:hypothetical protein